MYIDFLNFIPEQVINLIFATALGLFIGMEREWSQKPAGTRTFALISLVGSMLALTDSLSVITGGVIFVTVLALLLGLKGFIENEHSGLSLTTSASMLVTYATGVIVGLGMLLEGVTVAFISALLLVQKREIHQFALNLSKEELRSAALFAILAFVIYPLLPEQNIGPWNAINPKLVWTLVIAVSGIGFANYILIKQYEEKGFAVTGFFGGLVNSTAVIVSLANRANSDVDKDMIIGAILLANSAMSLRNAIILIAFVPSLAIKVGIPLGLISIIGVILSYISSGWTAEIDANIESPFSLKNALTFGAIFIAILVASAGAKTIFGGSGFVATSFIAGLVSSGSATTTSVTLLSSESITASIATLGVVAGTISSIIVKIFFASTASRDLAFPVLLWNLPLILVGSGSSLLLFLFL